jgi:hypothetical protein
MKSSKPSVGRFTWDKPVVKPADIQPGTTMTRINNNRAVRKPTSKIQTEYDDVKRKRRGEE